MNKQDIAIVVLLVALLFGWMRYQNKTQAERVRQWRESQAALAATNETAAAASAISAEAQKSAAITAAGPQINEAGAKATEAPAEAPAAPPAGEEEEDSGVPEKTATLSSEEVEIVVSSKGATIRAATLHGYRKTVAKDSGDICFDYSAEPALALRGVKGLGANADFEIVSSSPTAAVLRATAPSGLALQRTITLADGYRLNIADAFTAAEGADLPESSVSVGTLRRQARGNTSILSVDALPGDLDRNGGYGKVLHWERKRMLTGLFTGGARGGGCAGAPDGALFPETVERAFSEPQRWVAVKTRFFAQVLDSETPSVGYAVSAARSLERGPLLVDSVAARMLFPAQKVAAGESVVRRHSLYIGPKKHSVIKKFAPASGEIMEFGTFKWLCVVILPLLNFFYLIFRNYGVAIIVLTILVRLVFWPLTRKSNESMKKMGEIQPLVKEIQTKFKDDPQKLQQETMKLYREHKVNPMASCLPMLIQIPVFIALFVVLRSATELRFAPFLWIRDLSEPENLLKGVIPGVPALNILPFLMAGTMFLQSKLTPSMGDPQQQKMMMWMMPLMMFVMFYSMPSALLLYWTVSQLLAIVQLLRQRRARAAESATVGPDGVIDGESVSRQQRRRMEREGK